MEINQVTIFKLIFFTFCIVLITAFVVQIFKYRSTGMCSTLIKEPEVTNSLIVKNCPEGYYPNFGKFKDVSSELKCCVEYT